MKRVVLFIVAAVLVYGFPIGLVQAKNASVKPEQRKRLPITIVGKITNAQNLKPFFDEDAFLQLLPEPKDGKMSLAIEKNKIVVKSESPKSTFGKDGKFSFTVETLPPGKYFIVINNLNIQIGSNVPIDSCLFLARFNDKGQINLPDDRVKFNIEVNSKLPLNIDLGNVIVPIIGSKL